MGIKHRADSGFRKFSALRKIGLGRINKSFEMPYVSYPRTLTSAKQNHDTPKALSLTFAYLS